MTGGVEASCLFRSWITVNLLKWEEKPHLPPFLPSFLLQPHLVPQQRMGETGSVRVAPLCRVRKNLWKVQVKLLEACSWDKKGSEGAGALEAVRDADLEQGVSCSPEAAGNLKQHCSPADGLQPQYAGFSLQLAKSLPRLERGKWLCRSGSEEWGVGAGGWSDPILVSGEPQTVGSGGTDRGVPEHTGSAPCAMCWCEGG